MNNRQAGRRRGRGGQQQRSGGNPNQRDNGNRIDNRARGNAAQLLEKYKNLARDAQMQGDRVNAEYYFQFADHYFRVLSETRSRFEENNPNASRRAHEESEEEDFEFEAEGNRAEPQPQQQRADRDDREPRDQQRNGRANGNANGNGAYHGDQPFETRSEGEPYETRAEAREDDGQRRRGRPRRENGAERPAPEGIDAAVLPPAFGVEADAEPEDKPRRRGRPRRDADAPQA